MASASRWRCVARPEAKRMLTTVPQCPITVRGPPADLVVLREAQAQAPNQTRMHSISKALATALQSQTMIIIHLCPDFQLLVVGGCARMMAKVTKVVKMIKVPLNNLHLPQAAARALDNLGPRDGMVLQVRQGPQDLQDLRVRRCMYLRRCLIAGTRPTTKKLIRG